MFSFFFKIISVSLRTQNSQKKSYRPGRWGVSQWFSHTNLTLGLSYETLVSVLTGEVWVSNLYDWLTDWHTHMYAGRQACNHAQTHTHTTTHSHSKFSVWYVGQRSMDGLTDWQSCWSKMLPTLASALWSLESIQLIKIFGLVNFLKK